MNDRTAIEAATEQLPTVHEEHPVQIFNPLDADPQQFAVQLRERSTNYDALAQHLRGQLVPDKDFGRIHVANKGKCPEPWYCNPDKAPGHWSGFTLFSPGADKVLGILGLGVKYPDEQDYRRAALNGRELTDIIIKAFVISSRDQVISEGMGAAAVGEHQGSLNNALKKALKRARLDAVNRIPTVSALFEDDFLASLAQSADAKTANTTNARVHDPSNLYNTGATLTVFPFGKKLGNVPFKNMDDGTLEWILANFQDKPDIFNAANLELQQRSDAGACTGGGSQSDDAPRPYEEGEDPFNDELPPLET